MTGILQNAKTVLHGDYEQHRTNDGRSALTHLFLTIFLCGATYGASMGSSGGFEKGEALQILYSAVKVPLLLLATFMLSLPSFFVLNTLSGLRNDFEQALRALVAGQAGMTIGLAALAPIVLFWNVSVSDNQGTVLFNGLLFGVATLGGQILLRRYYRPLLARDQRHRSLLRVWGVLYSFVGIQMGWVLRPFVGEPGKAVHFFRADAWGNAYLMVWRLVAHVVRR